MKLFAKGSLRIECIGDFERLLGRCRQNNISMWDIEKRDDLSVSFCCGVGEIYFLRKLCRGCSCRIRVIKKKGMPFLARRALKRPVLTFGVLAIAVFLFLMSRCVWSVEIQTEGKIKENQIRELVKEAGLKPGVLKRSVRSQKIKNHVIRQNKDTLYLTVNIEGSTAYVNAYERIPMPERQTKEPCDLISGLTGIITSCRIKQGTSLVRAGQAIFEGDTIVSGEIVDKNGEIRYYHSDGEIDVRTVYTRKCVLPNEMFELIPTGKTKTRSYLIVGDKTVKLYLIETVSYKWYYKSVERKELRLGSNRLPVTLVTETYSECSRMPCKLDTQEADDILSARMLAAFARQKSKAAIINSSFNLLEQNGRYEGIMRLECSETTGIRKSR